MAEDLNLSIKVAMESQSFQTQIADINRSMKVVQSEFSAASSKLGEFGSSTDALKVKAGSLGQQLDLQNQVVTKYAEQYNKAKDTLAKNATANEELKQKVNETTKAYDASVLATGKNSDGSKKLKTELDGLNKEFSNSQSTINSNVKSVDNYSIKLNNAQTSANKLEGELSKTNTSLKTNGKSFDENETKISTAGKSFDGLGEKISTFGKVAAVGILAVGTAFAGFATIGVTTSDELIKSLNGIQSATGYSDESMSAMKDTMVSIYNNNFGENFDDIGKAIEEVGKQTGTTGKELEGLTSNALMLRDTFGFEITESIRSANMMINQFGLDGAEAYNLIAQGAQLGLDKNGDLLDTLNEYSGTFKAQGFSAEEMFNMLQNGAADGTFSVDKLGDAVKEFGIRSKDQSTTTSDAFNKLGLDVDATGEKFAKGGDTAKQAFQDVNKKLLEMQDPLAQNQIGVELWGSMWEDLGVKGIKALTDTKGEISNTTDALKGINDIKYSSFGEGIEGIKRQLLTGIALPLGENVLPKLNEFGNYLKDNMSQIIADIKPIMNNLIDSFKFLADHLNVIIPVLATVLSGFVAFKAITGTIVLVSTLSTVFTTVSGAIALLTTTSVAATPAIASLAGAFTVLTGPIGIAAAAIAVLTIGGIALYNHFKQEVIPTTDLFGKTTSEATKKAVQGYLDLDTNATKSLMSLNFSGQAISKETATALETTFADMGTKIKTGMDAHYEDSLKTMKDTFAKSSALTDTEEASILAKMKIDNDNRKKSVDDGEKQIKTILDTASAAKRALTTDEQTAINKIQNTMKTNAVKSLSDTEVESKSILERMKQQSGDITAQQAADVVKNSLEQKTKAVANANEQYDNTVKAIIKQRDETGTISADQAQKLIADATKTRDDSVKSATDMNTKVVEQAKLQAKDHVNQVDWTSGQVKTKWQEMTDNIGTKMGDIKTDISTKWGEIKADTFTKVEDLKTGVNNTFKNLGILVFDTWNGIKTSIKESINGIIGNINSFISFVNNIKINVPSVDIPLVGTVGGYSIGMPQIPSIPMLAEGGITNGPMQAIIGDNKSGREAVIPIEKIDDIIASAIKKANGSGKSGDTINNYTFTGDLNLPDVKDTNGFIKGLKEMAWQEVRKK